MPQPQLVTSHCTRSTLNHLIVERGPAGAWLVLRYTDEMHSKEIVSIHPTEQAAERECRRLMFPPTRDDWKGDE